MTLDELKQQLVLKTAEWDSHAARIREIESKIQAIKNSA